MYKPKLKELLPLIDNSETIELYYKGGYVGEYFLLDQINNIPEWVLNTTVFKIGSTYDDDDNLEIQLREQIL